MVGGIQGNNRDIWEMKEYRGQERYVSCQS